MDWEHWQARAKTAGLSQKMLAYLLGFAENTISRQLRGKWSSGTTPRHVVAAIVAWELMSEEQRDRWFEEVERSARPVPA